MRAQEAVKAVPRGLWHGRLALGLLAGSLLALPTHADEANTIASRIEAAFNLVMKSPASAPPDRVTRSTLVERAMKQRDTATALAYRQVEPEPSVFALVAPEGRGAGAVRGRTIQMARLPKPRPEQPIVTGSLAPSGKAPHPAQETEFFNRFSGSFSGSGEVKRNAQASANQVKCTLTGRPSASGVSISGECGAFIFSREVRADIRYDPASGVYTGTYIGASIGPANLYGKRRGDQVVLTINWPKPVNGDTMATMIINNGGNGKLDIVVTDQVHPGGPTAEVTRLALSQH